MYLQGKLKGFDGIAEKEEKKTRGGGIENIGVHLKVSSSLRARIRRGQD